MVKYLDLELHFGTQKPASECGVSAQQGLLKRGLALVRGRRSSSPGHLVVPLTQLGGRGCSHGGFASLCGASPASVLPQTLPPQALCLLTWGSIALLPSCSCGALSFLLELFLLASTPLLLRSRPMLVCGSQLGREWVGRRIAKPFTPMLPGGREEGGAIHTFAKQVDSEVLPSSALLWGHPGSPDMIETSAPHNAQPLLWPSWMSLE